MKKRTIGLFFILISILTGTAFGQQTTEDIRSLLEERDQQIKELVGPEGTSYSEEQRAKMKEIINGIIDFEAMSKEALSVTFDTISVQQQEEFVDLFSTIVRDQSLNNLDIYRADVRYEDISVEENTARVETMATLKNVRTPVNYELAFKNNEWVITDMEIDDVSTAGSYNRQFQRIISQKGFDSLMESLRKRAERA
ncbi:MAG: ABC transporter substrate-binding protein [Gracilimonas sp.]|jgi:phospholipid transport system substrate-binding protein|nr:ABC transporter substrate-binding protein [Gracilimonas sp.]